MRKRFLLFLAGVVLPVMVGTTATAGCAGCGDVQIETNPPEPDSGLDAHHDHHVPSTSSSSGGGSDAHDALPDYVDPGCPEAGPKITMFTCNPFDPNDPNSTPCPDGEGCYIFVQYPQEPCGQEIYGSLCNPVGPGGQGDPCGGLQDCGGGFACVVSGSGDQCVQLCPLTGQSNCPEGLSCEPIDVEGFGGCL
jgi:hypothetical protein